MTNCRAALLRTAARPRVGSAAVRLSVNGGMIVCLADGQRRGRANARRVGVGTSIRRRRWRLARFRSRRAASALVGSMPAASTVGMFCRHRASGPRARGRKQISLRAAQCRRRAAGARLVAEFSLRRAHEPDGACADCKPGHRRRGCTDHSGGRAITSFRLGRCCPTSARLLRPSGRGTAPAASGPPGSAGAVIRIFTKQICRRATSSISGVRTARPCWRANKPQSPAGSTEKS